MKPTTSSLKKRITALFSWISFSPEDERSVSHPETLIFKNEETNQSSWKSKKHIFSVFLTLLFFAFCAGLYALTLKGVAGNPNPREMKRMDKSSFPFELSPERGRYAHTYALAEQGSFSLSQDLADVVYPDVGYVDGRFYSFFAPGISIFAVPFYKLGSIFNLAQVFTFSVISLFAMGSLFFLFRIGKDIFKLPVANALLAPIIFAFGSTSWSYATTLYQHHLTTFFILSSFYAVWRFAQKSRLSFLWGSYIWFCYAASFTVDYPNLLFMAPVMLYFFLSSVNITRLKQKLSISIRPAFITTSIFFFIISFLHGYYNYTQFGDFKRLSGNIVGYKTIREHQLLENEVGKNKIKEIADDKPSSAFFLEENIVRGMNELLVAPDKGIFFFSPIFLLAIAAIATIRKKMENELAVLLSLVAVNMFLYASFGDPWGGWAFGPRYLVLSMSVLSLFIAMWASRVKYQIFAKVMLVLLFAFSSAVSLLGVLTTNAVPPKIEADFIGSKYGYFLNLDYLQKGISSSFLYNDYFANILTLQQYFLGLYVSLMLVFLLIVLCIRKVKIHEN